VTPGPPRLVASDLDGTLMHGDSTVSPRTRAVLAKVQASGVPLVLVTGRPPRWMHMVAEQTGHAGLALVANGAGTYDLRTERLVRSDPIEPEDAAEVIRLVAAAVPDAVFAGEIGVAYLREEGYRSAYGDTPDTRIVPREEISSVPLLKLLVRTPSYDADALLAAAQVVVGEHLATLTHSSRDGLLEISRAGVSKASALGRVARELDVDAAEAIAFGDMPNDLPMLRWAGRSYAVRNAHPAVLAAADEVTRSNDEDGVAVVLERWF
jgi:Cof subfamily protein (haloacid dehalogenase superfamily)